MAYAVNGDENMFDVKFGCICARWSTSDEMYHRVCGKEAEGGSENVGEGY